MVCKYITTLDCNNVVKSRQPANSRNVLIAYEVKRARPGWRIRIEQSDNPLHPDLLIPNLVP